MNLTPIFQNSAPPIGVPVTDDSLYTSNVAMENRTHGFGPAAEVRK